MVRGESGRIVLEINPSQKDELYSALTRDGLTLKEWFLRQTAQYLRSRSQGSLFSGSSVLEELVPLKVKSPPAKVLSSKTKINGVKAKLK